MNKVLALQEMPLDVADEAADNSPLRGSTVSLHCGHLAPADK